MLSALETEPAKTQAASRTLSGLTAHSDEHLMKVFSLVRMADSRDFRYKKITFLEVVGDASEHRE